MNIIVPVSGRADAVPLSPVVAELRKRRVNVQTFSLEGCDIDEAANTIARYAPQYDLMLCLGDRFETLAAASCAAKARVPIAHIHGGEVTLGSTDNKYRHAITQLADVHFVATYRAEETVAEMGRVNIHLVGAPGLDWFLNMPPRVKGRTIIFTYHPVTTLDDYGYGELKQVLECLEAYKKNGYEVIWTGINNDPGADELEALIRAYGHKPRKIDYVAECRKCAIIVGNSSSGVIEAPTMEVPSVNVGIRQHGREMGPSVITYSLKYGYGIGAAIEMALDYDGPFTNPYGGLGASKKIVDILLSREPHEWLK